jgi:hypothetical protein
MVFNLDRVECYNYSRRCQFGKLKSTIGILVNTIIQYWKCDGGKCYARICYICLTIYKLKTHITVELKKKIEVNVMPEFATYV